MHHCYRGSYFWIQFKYPYSAIFFPSSSSPSPSPSCSPSSPSAPSSPSPSSSPFTPAPPYHTPSPNSPFLHSSSLSLSGMDPSTYRYLLFLLM
ncbi:unnamed protein product [Closterium sp. NIES-53]